MNYLDGNGTTNPEKLSVTFTPGVTLTDPIIGRKYTISYSNVSGEISMWISLRYLFEKVREGEQGIFGGWGTYYGQYAFYMFLSYGESTDPSALTMQERAFRSLIPSVLSAIKTEDRAFFLTHLELNYVPIIVYYVSRNPNFNRAENWGTFSMYGGAIGDEISEYD